MYEKTKKDLLVAARNRIVAAISSYNNDNFDWVSDIDQKKYQFIEVKYGKYIESYPDNQLYGKGALFRYTHNIPADNPLHIILPHGIHWANTIWSKDIRAGLPIACYSDYIKCRYEEIGKKYKQDLQTFSCVHPFIKVLKEMKMKEQDNKYSSTSRTNDAIYFPNHSTDTVVRDIYNNKSKLFRHFEQLRNIHSSLNLCVFHIDHKKLEEIGLWHEYKSYFDKVYCCGNRLDPAFLVFLASILRLHRTLVVDSVGGQTFYGLMAGLQLSMVSPSKSIEIRDVSDTFNAKRPDIHVRKRRRQEGLMFHDLLEKSGNDKECILKRYYNEYLKPSELEIQQEILKNQLPETHYAFSREFNESMHPLVD